FGDLILFVGGDFGAVFVFDLDCAQLLAGALVHPRLLSLSASALVAGGGVVLMPRLMLVGLLLGLLSRIFGFGLINSHYSNLRRIYMSLTRIRSTGPFLLSNSAM